MQFGRRGLCLIVAGLCAACCARAQSQASQADVKAFVSEYVAAFNAKDATRLLALYDPKWLACITPESKAFYDGLMAVQWRDPIPATYTLTVGAVDENNLKGYESNGPFPVKPSLQAQIDYQQGDDSGTMVLLLVRESGRLFGDAPCASEQALKQFRDEAPARAKLAAQNKALAAAIKEPLRSQLMALLRQHRTSQAIDRYKEASGQDMRTSMFVIDVLAHEKSQ